jgi:hypothetical protein
MSVLGFLREWPIVTFLPAALYFALGVRTRRALVWSAGFIWAGYGMYELLMKTHVLCPDECARADVLFIDPFLIVLSVVALLSASRGRKETDLA